MAAAVSSEDTVGHATDAPLVVIVGPTASGKTDVALRLAADFNGEVIAADSRTIYRGLDIGTAKPTIEERERVPHHLIDIIDPDETYSAARFQADARHAIAAIRRRGHVPFLVGGSGLYVDGLLYDYEFGPAGNAELRRKLDDMTINELLHYCTEKGITIPDNYYNKRYVIRAIEQGGVNTKKTMTPIENTIIVGIATDKNVLESRIRMRSEAMFNGSLIEEALRAGQLYGWQVDPLRAPVYTLAHGVIKGKITTKKAVEELTVSDRRLAKKQRTWFRRNEHITWLDGDRVYPFVAQALKGSAVHVTLKT